MPAITIRHRRPKMRLIELRDIRKTYIVGEIEVNALESVSLEIDRGEYVALHRPLRLGKNHADEYARLPGSAHQRQLPARRRRGSQDVGRRARPRAKSEDRIRLPELQLAGPNDCPGERRVAALVFHQAAPGERRGAGRKLLEKVGLGSRMGHHPSQLSGGQQQRVAIARALANEPPIILADEPTGNLDSRTSREVMDLFQRLNEEDGITIVLVTHDPDVAHERRAVVVRDGRVVCDSTDFPRVAAAMHALEEQIA